MIVADTLLSQALTVFHCGVLLCDCADDLPGVLWGTDRLCRDLCHWCCCEGPHHTPPIYCAYPGSICLLHARLTVTHDQSGMYLPPLHSTCPGSICLLHACLTVTHGLSGTYPPNRATPLSSLRLPHCHCWKSWQRTPSQLWRPNWGETHVQAEFWFTAEGYSTSCSDAHCFMLEEDWEKIGWMNWEASTQTGRIPGGRQSVSDLVLAVS